MTLEEALAAIEALKKKNEEVLGEKKAASKKAEEAEAAKKKAEDEKAEAERAAEEAEARKAGDIKKLEESLTKKHADELKKKDDEISTLKKAMGDLETARDSLVLDKGLADAIAEVGVGDQFKPAVQALLRAQGAKVEMKDGQFVAMIGEKKLADAVKEFAASDAGKHFVTNNNSGGGAPGGGTVTTGNPYKKGDVAFNRTKQGELEATNKAQANKYRAEVGLAAI